MTSPAPLHNRIRAAVDQDGAAALLCRVVGTPSVTGGEGLVAQVLADELRAVGMGDVKTEEFLPGRSNVWGVRRGTGGGRSLMLTGHIDTVHVRGWREHWNGTERENPFAAAIVDGQFWGRGVGDMKGGICAQIAALGVLERCGLRPRGDIVCVYNGDEESGEPNSGVSAGLKAIVPRVKSGEILRADFAICGEPTRLNVAVAQAGFFIADLTIAGKTAYFAFPEQGVDALRATHSVLSAIWDYSAELENRHPHALVGRGLLLVTEMSAGGYIAVPGQCRLSLIGKIPPGENMDTIRREFEQTVLAAPVAPGVKIEIHYPAERDHSIGGTPYELPSAMDAAKTLGKAAAAAFPGRGEIEGLPAWGEAPIVSRSMGIPTVYFGPGDIMNCHTLEERTNVSEFFAAIEAYALFIVEFCGVEGGGELA
jgi:acetylornithine deacetylase